MKPRSDQSSLWRALRHRDFRLLWLGQAVSAGGTWLAVVAQSLLVLRLSDGSPLALGGVSLAQAAAFVVFSLVGGGVADRVPRRRLLLWTQAALLALATLLGTVTLTGLVTVPLVVLLAFVTAAVASFDQPARAALLPDLVPEDDLPAANALSAVTNNTAATLGPAVAGLVVAALGEGVAFLLNAASFLAVLAALLCMRTPGAVSHPARRIHLFASIGEGGRVIARDAVLARIVGLYGLLLLLGPSPSLMLPLFAQNVLMVGAAELGLLFAAFGAGTVAGAAVLSARPSPARPHTFLRGALLAWSAALLVFALSRSWPLSFGALFALGAARNAAGVTATTLMQSRAPSAARGRVMSVNTLLSNGLRPLGDFAASASMAALSVPLVAGVVAVVVGASAARSLARPPSGEGLDEAR